ncbi:MAG: RNA polymerase factor sigma-32 [Magnetococcales bacterium]|nr:RNA polymerase factor sigma-32 [Magnetococcales bacterium]
MTTTSVAITRSSDLVAFDNSSGFQTFFQQAMNAPMLSAEEEFQLATRYRECDDLDAAHKLVQSYLRLVLKTAREYLHYKLSLPDLVQEGAMGLMVAVKRFDPKRGARLATYAIWWIRASIHDFILRSWRMVKIATTQLKRKLFFKLRQAKASAAPLNYDEAAELAEKFGTDAETILEVDDRMVGGDVSLNQPVLDDAGEMIHLLEDQRPDQEYELLSMQQKELMASLIQQGMERLNDREQVVISERLLAEDPATLAILSKRFSVSRERIRQIEKRGLEKLRTFFQTKPEARDLVLGS